MRHAHSFKHVSPEALSNRLEAGEKLVLLDVLPADHYRKIHLPEARNACVYEVTFLDQVVSAGCTSSTAIIVYGTSGNSLESHTAAEKLSMAGYYDVTVLEGGLERWRQSGYPLVGQSHEQYDSREPERLLQDGRYQILPAESRIGWTGRNPNSSHFGTVNITGGSLNIYQSSLQGSISVDMDSIENINLAGSDLQSVLISHLKSDDFFFVDAFPAARFEIRGGRFSHEPYPTRPNCEVSGTLDLRGVQNDLQFKATLVKATDGNLHLSAHFDLDRTAWGITYGSSRFYEHLGMHSVFDNISLELLIVAELNPE